MHRLVDRARGAAMALLLASIAFEATAHAQARRLVVDSQDAALLSALSAKFSPRGFEVVAATPGAADADVAVVADADADAVWLCEPESGATALCVRPHHGQIIVRHTAMSTPLSPADAAALALSVEVALMPEESPVPLPVANRRLAASSVDVVATPVRQPQRFDSATHGLTVEVMGGAGASTTGTGARAGVDAVYAPAIWARRLGLGVAIAGGRSGDPPPGLTRAPLGVPSGARPVVAERDATVRLFARGAVWLSPIWLQLDLGPAAHLVDLSFLEDRNGGSSQLSFRMSADGALGAVIPIGRFFAGVRVGASHLVYAGERDLGPTHSAWAGEGFLTVGASFR